MLNPRLLPDNMAEPFRAAERRRQIQHKRDIRRKRAAKLWFKEQKLAFYQASHHDRDMNWVDSDMDGEVDDDDVLITGDVALATERTCQMQFEGRIAPTIDVYGILERFLKGRESSALEIVKLGCANDTEGLFLRGMFLYTLWKKEGVSVDDGDKVKAVKKGVSKVMGKENVSTGGESKHVGVKALAKSTKSWLESL